MGVYKSVDLYFSLLLVYNYFIKTLISGWTVILILVLQVYLFNPIQGGIFYKPERAGGGHMARIV